MAFPPNIILVGFMGSGKTSTGKELAGILGLSFCDMDQWIEGQTGKKVHEIFADEGEAYFREQEGKAVRFFALQEQMVVATGGGAWTNQTHRELLLRSGWCLWLQVSPEYAWARVKGNLLQRPLLAGAADPLSELRKKMGERDTLYSLAQRAIDTDGKTPRDVALEIAEIFLKEKPFGSPPRQE